MKYVMLDTSHIDLNIGLVNDETLIASYAQPSPKTQSENIIPKLDELFSMAGWNIDEVDGVVVTRGPGSYTGVRIAMTVAKVLCSTKNIPLFTVSTLQAMAGMHEHALVLLDARSNRVYAGIYDKGVAVMADCILSLEEARKLPEEFGYTCIGDASLIGCPSRPITLLENIVQLKPFWEQVPQVHQLMPTYLKDQDAYGK